LSLASAQTFALSVRPARARREVESLLVRHAWAVGTEDVALALHEALVNAQRHAGGAVRAEACFDGSSVVLKVWDRGPGFDLDPYVHRPPDPMSERGRGLWLISRVAAAVDVHYHDDGVALVMRFDRPNVMSASSTEVRQPKSRMLC
jgi:anti-sigma regulatory factor (Ser/Thr protein kinase)